MRLVDFFVVLVLILAGVALTMSIAGTDDADEEQQRGRLALLETRMLRLERESEARAAGVAEMEARLAALEGAPIREGAPPPEAWTDADVEALRAGLERVRAAERRERDASRLRDAVTDLVPDVKPAVREEAVALLLETARKVRSDPDRVEALRDVLRAKLEERFPGPVAERLARLVPGPDAAEGPR